MMIFHNKCGNNVLVDLASSFKMLATFGITAKGISAGTGTMINMGTTCEISFYCPDCRTTVPFDDMRVRCQWGGEIIPVEDAYIVEGSGGYYCRTHAMVIASATGSNLTPLITVLKNCKTIRTQGA